MMESRRSEPAGGLYERLLQRLAVALDEAESTRRLRDIEPQLVELKGLTNAEMELIQAYLERDLHWLQGWHAAAAELEYLEHQSLRQARTTGVRVNGKSSRPATSKLELVKPRLKRRQQLCCAMCGTQVPWLRGQGVTPCPACGSQLFRASAPR